MVYHTSLPYGLPYMVYIFIIGDFPLYLRLERHRGGVPNIMPNSTKKSNTNLWEKTVVIRIYKLGDINIGLALGLSLIVSGECLGLGSTFL
jgi:hypothetical protein